MKLTSIFVGMKVCLNDCFDAVVYDVKSVNDTIVEISCTNFAGVASNYNVHYSLIKEASKAQLRHRD